MITWDNIIGVANLVTAGAIIFLFRQVKINRKQLYFSTIAHCIHQLKSIPDLQNINASEKTVWDYIDLCNEELFYFQYKYLPKKIAYEWLDGMMDFIPILDLKNNIINPENSYSALFNKRNLFLKNYPRIKYTFKIKSKYNISLLYTAEEDLQDERIKEREKILKELYRNITSLQLVIKS